MSIRSRHASRLAGSPFPSSAAGADRRTPGRADTREEEKPSRAVPLGAAAAVIGVLVILPRLMK